MEKKKGTKEKNHHSVMKKNINHHTA